MVGSRNQVFRAKHNSVAEAALFCLKLTCVRKNLVSTLLLEIFMTNMEFLDEPISVVASTDKQGEITPQGITWRNRQYQIMTVGRQWDEGVHRYLLLEATDGTRFEVEFCREDLCWRVKKVWWGQIIV
jgi:hypothetical protein